ncbi:hypothetical protein IJD44_01530 [bacterium]|nr:hypothetical protein [bacterium]
MGNKKVVKEVKVQEITNIETSLDEITNMEEYISQIVGNGNFYNLNKEETPQNTIVVREEEKSFGFISVVANTISEEEFLAIVDADGKRCKRSAGLYQQSLFSRYMAAKKEEDYGYIQDIFEKAVELRDNLERVTELKKNKSFMKEWRQNVGRVNPESELKNSGSMRKIHIIESLSM